MNPHCLLSVLVGLGFLLPVVCPAQSISRGGEARTRDALEGDSETKSANTNAAAILVVDASSPRSLFPMEVRFVPVSMGFRATRAKS